MSTTCKGETGLAIFQAQLLDQLDATGFAVRWQQLCCHHKRNPSGKSSAEIHALRHSQQHLVPGDAEPEPGEAAVAVSGCRAALPAPEPGWPQDTGGPSASRGGSPSREQPDPSGAAVQGALLPMSGEENPRIPESQHGGVGRALCGSPSPTPCPSSVTQSRGHSTASRQGLNISREGDSTASLGSLGQGSVTLRGKKFFLIFSWSFLCLSLCPLPLVLVSPAAAAVPWARGVGLVAQPAGTVWDAALGCWHPCGHARGKLVEFFSAIYNHLYLSCKSEPASSRLYVYSSLEL